jgi:hypothetical protein
MREIHASSQICVYDDFVSEVEHREIWDALQQERYTPVPTAMGVHRIDDGQPLRCDRSFLWTGLPEEELPPRQSWKDRLHLSTGKFHAFLSNVSEVASHHCDLVGAIHSDWAGIVLTPHLYRRGDAVSWHTDGFSYTGAFVYYAHQYWNCLWGGELLVVDERTGRDPTHFGRKCLLDNAAENERLLSPGLGQFVFPKPNRLVFIAGGNDHMISKVYDAAGNNVRAGLSGFFLKKEAAERTITK